MLRLKLLQIRFKLKHTDGAYQFYPMSSLLFDTEIIQLRQAGEFIFELSMYMILMKIFQYVRAMKLRCP